MAGGERRESELPDAEIPGDTASFLVIISVI